ncbi:UBA-like superfamily [Sesbania bispinosa]|nr:UBA-like superfamily [Sesbania bispinosa]
MNPVIPCSIGNVSIIPGISYSTRTNNSLTRLSLSRSSVKPGSSTWRFLFPSFVSSGVLPKNKRICSFHKKSRTSISVTETDVAVEEPGSPVADEVSGDIPSDEVRSEDSSPKSDVNPIPAKTRNSRPARKSEMPPVKNEDLIPGATFTGKVKSIMPFGAFVDFGAFTDGLVHVSMLSDSYVKDVASIVSVGQEVKVKLLEVNTETQRISLSMRENADTSKQRKDAPTNAEKAGLGRRNTSKPSPKKDVVKKSTKFVKGQELQGTVKNMTRSGAFISLPEGEEGFLPISEEPDDGFGNVMGNTSLEVGQEVSVRVLRIARGQATLTMKKEEDVAELDAALEQGGVVHVATNPFVLAFRKNKDISAFLDEREKTQNEVQISSTTRTLDEIKGTVKEEETVSDAPDVQGEPQSINKLTDDISENEEDVGASALDGSSTTTVDDESYQVSNVSSPMPDINGATEKETEVVSGSLAPEGDQSAVNPIIEEAIQTDVTTSNVTTDSLLDSDAAEPSPDKIGTITESDITSSAPATQETADDNVGAVPEDDDSDISLSGQNGELSPEGSLNQDVTGENDQVPPPESLATEVVDNSIDDLKEEVQEQTPAEENENSLSSQVEDEEVAIASEENGSLSNSNGQTGITTSDQGLSKATISPALVKQLREETGAGMMECKKALSETGGDIIKAQEFLRKKGLASAEKKASRATAEGRIGSYIHDSRIGVLVEVNCETDFVSRDVPEEIVNKEKEIEMQKEDLLSRPEQIRSKIVEGRIRKRLEDLALLEQPYIKNDKVAVKDWVKQTIATIGENIKVKRFVRFNLGEGLEKKSQDFAAEVAAQTAAKPVPTPVTEQPAVAEAKETEQKQSTVTVSASLVKQLREETGAGMMDCKKALAETGGDLEKAQEYLRKKGLSTADKKSSRLAAEGRIGSYIHDSRIGVLIEVNCETDFVGRSEKFKELVDDLAMQVVACPQVQFVSIEDIPEDYCEQGKRT